MNRRGLFCLVAVVCLLFSAGSVAAQKITGDITGTVTDASGAVVVNATVTATNKATNFTRTANTSDAGFFRISDLPIGAYRVSASLQGFKTIARDAQVTTGQVTTSDFVLQVGDRAETVTVEAAAPLIEYTGQVNNYVDEERINQIPLNGRDFNSLLGITPGVQRSPGGGFLAVNISGARRTANNYLIDGMYNNDRYYGDSSLNQTGVVGIPATLIPMDAIAEFTVQQTPSAEFGVKGGGAINMQLKSGGNEWHGSAHYFRHTDWTDARNFFAADKTNLRNQQYGATLGGPLVKDKTFVFGYWEAQRYSSFANWEEDAITSGMVALARARIACTAGVNNMPGCVPQATSPAGEALLTFYPVVNDPSTNSIRVPVASPTSARMDSYAIKLDHRFSQNHLLQGRYVIGDSTQSAPAFIGTWPAAAGNISGLGLDGFNSFAPSRATQIGVNWIWNVSPARVIEFRAGYQRFSQILGPNNKIDPQALGIDTGPLDPLDFGIPAVYTLGPSYLGYIGGVGGYPIVTQPNDSIDISVHHTWITGNHTFKMGGNWQRAMTKSIRNRARSVLGFYGYYGYGPSGNGDVDAIVQLLLGRADSAARSFGTTPRHLFQNSLGLYVNDDWKIHPRLTLTLGVRWDVSGALGEKDNLGSNFIPSLGLVDLGAGIDALYDKDGNNFGPRVGFAWDILGNGKVALRGGYSLTYDIPNFGSIHAPRTAFAPIRNRAGAFTSINQGIFSVARFGNLTTASGYPEDPAATCLNATGVGDFVCLTGAGSLYGPNPTAVPPFDVFSVVRDLKTPSYHYWNVTFQYEFAPNNVITTTYLASRGRSMLMYIDLNAFPLGCNLSGTCVRPFATAFPNFQNIIQLTNLGKSWYDSLQLSYRQSEWKGFNTQYNLTWGHCLDYNSINRGSFMNLPAAMNPLDPALNKGNCDHDVTLNFNAAGTYDFPKIESWGRMGRGWQMGAVVTLIDGRPFTPNLGSFDPSGQSVGTIRADCNGPITYNTRDPNNYVDNSSGTFTVPFAGTLGNCGRNILRGPGLAQWDWSLIKTTEITERVKLELRWEIFNLFNRANFGAISTNIRSGAFGTIASTPDVDVLNPVIAQGGPRNMQWAVKIKF